MGKPFNRYALPKNWGEDERGRYIKVGYQRPSDRRKLMAIAWAIACNSMTALIVGAIAWTSNWTVIAVTLWPLICFFGLSAVSNHASCHLKIRTDGIEASDAKVIPWGDLIAYRRPQIGIKAEILGFSESADEEGLLLLERRALDASMVFFGPPDMAFRQARPSELDRARGMFWLSLIGLAITVSGLVIAIQSLITWLTIAAMLLFLAAVLVTLAYGAKAFRTYAPEEREMRQEPPLLSNAMHCWWLFKEPRTFVLRQAQRSYKNERLLLYGLFASMLLMGVVSLVTGPTREDGWINLFILLGASLLTPLGFEVLLRYYARLGQHAPTEITLDPISQTVLAEGVGIGEITKFFAGALKHKGRWVSPTGAQYVDAEWDERLAEDPMPAPEAEETPLPDHSAEEPQARRSESPPE